MDRTPYGPTLDLLDALYVPFNYTAILQNQRGCFTSGGDYDFWKMDGSDAYDTMVWFTNHSSYNGEIFISGASADGNSAMCDWSFPVSISLLCLFYFSHASRLDIKLFFRSFSVFYLPSTLSCCFF